MQSSIEKPKEQRQINEAPINIRDDLEDLLRDKQLDTLKIEVLKKQLESIYANLETFPFEKEPESYGDKEKVLINSVFMVSGGLMQEAIQRNLLLPQGQQRNLYSPETFLASFPAQHKEPGATHALQFLYRVLQQKTTNPALYAKFFGEWPQAIAHVTDHVQKKAQKQVGTAEQAVKEQVQKANISGEKPKEWWEYAQDPKILGLGIGAVGAAMLVFNIFSGKKDWKMSIIPAITAFLGFGMAGGMKLNIGDIFKGMEWPKLPGLSASDSPQGSTETDIQTQETALEREEKKDWKPLKEVYKEGFTSLEMSIGGMHEAMERNTGMTAVAGMTLAKIPLVQSILFSGPALGAEAVMGLAKLSLGTAAHHPVGSMFAVSSFLMMKDNVTNLADIKVPASGDALKTYLDSHYTEIQEFCTKNGLVVPQRSFLGETVDILQGKTPLDRFLPEGVNFAAHVTDKVRSYVGATPEKMVQNINGHGLRDFSQYLRQQQTKDAENALSYVALQKVLEGYQQHIKAGKPLNKADYIAISKAPEFAALQMELIFDEGEIRVMRYKNEQGVRVPDPHFPQVIGIDPSASKDTQHEKAIRLATRKDWKQILNPAWRQTQESADFVMKQALEIMHAKSLTEALKSGTQVAVEGGRVYLIGATNRVFFGTWDLVKGSLDAAFSKESDMGMQQVLMQYGSTLLPVTFFGITRHMMRLRHPLKQGFPVTLAQSALYPVKTIADGIQLLYGAGSALINKGSYSSIAKDPFEAAALKLTSKIDAAKKLRYTFQVETQKHYKDMVELKNAKALLIESGRTILPEIKSLGIRGQEGVLEQAKKLLDSNAFGKKIIDSFRDLERTNRVDIASAIDLAMEKKREIIALEKQKGQWKKNSPQYDNIVALIENIEHEFYSAVKLRVEKSKVHNTEAVQSATKEHVDMEKKVAQQRLAVSYETLGEKAPRSLQEALSRMDALTTSMTKDNMEKHMKLYQLFEKSADDMVRAGHDVTGKNADFTGNVEEMSKNLAERSEKIRAAREKFSQTLREQFDKLPVHKRTKARAEAINKVLKDTDHLISTRVLSIKGRTMLFGAQFAAAMAAQVAVETALDKDHDLMKALSGLKSTDTLQMLVDLVPGLGSMSNLMSVYTGKKSLSSFGVAFDNAEVSRWESAGWGVVSLGSDILMLVPAAGAALKGGVITARLANLAEKVPAAKQLQAAWKPITRFAETHGWTETMTALVNYFSKNAKSISVATSAATAGMTAYTGYNIAVAYNASTAREVPLVKPAVS